MPVTANSDFCEPAFAGWRSCSNYRHLCLQSFLASLLLRSQILRSCFSGISRQASFVTRYTSAHLSVQRFPLPRTTEVLTDNPTNTSNSKRLELTISLIRFISFLLSRSVSGLVPLPLKL